MVVFPDCRGPVTDKTGNDALSSLIRFSIDLGMNILHCFMQMYNQKMDLHKFLRQ